MRYSAVLAVCSLFACMDLQAGVPADAADSISSRLAAGGAEDYGFGVDQLERARGNLTGD